MTAATISLVAATSASAGPTQRTAASAGTAQVTCSAPTPPSNPGEITEVGGGLFFTADDGVHGAGLWRSDGTSAGTVFLRAFKTGETYDAYYYGPSDLTAVGGTLFFTADDGVHGPELWRSDGTRSGTALVKDIGKRKDQDGPSDLTVVDQTLYFTADDGVHGRELWKSDGTEAGTVVVKDLDLDTGGDYYDDNDEQAPSLVTVGNTLFFNANNDATGVELWKTTGSQGTALVDDIRAGGYDSDPSDLTAVGGKLFFTARDGTTGRELWTSDGTQGGTTRVKDIHPGAADSTPTYLTDVGGKLFFVAGDGEHGRELWTSDGTEAHTALVKNINPVVGDESDAPSELTAVDGKLFFTADDGVHGSELWSSTDGTEANTTMVQDVHPGAYGSDPRWLTEMGGKLFFTAKDGTHGPELWTSDGTSGHTTLVKNIEPGVKGEGPTYLTDVGGTLFFAADDGTHGNELWTSDGTGASTALFKDVNLGGKFTVAARGTANTRNGTLKVGVTTQGAGHLAVGPVGTSLLKSSTYDPPSAGATTVTLAPTAAGMRTLKRTGALKVTARFTFTPCGGTGSSINRSYTLRLR